ncbi:hypothetical protein [Oxalicibacterium faecigallinarum]|uniref:Uncharacterized protein n=1 Tax=Oxalicibacterium faecigallinarum TaxID=573741 RepID=A0A8J3AUQ8_9BURK|nr:hypothetical protein [Oxalicibacterium faecigallinarum]GGI16901.1 hypothetical protein GCM10008066_06280 [Oxalicibacterium faecigallinarum]
MSGDAALAATAAVNPYAAVIGAALNAAQAPPAGPSNASSLGTIGGNLFDTSGFNVTFGDNAGISTERTQTETGQFDKYLPYLIVGAVFLVAWRYVKK